MAKEVIKRDGRKEPFDAKKIRNSIADTAKEAGLSGAKKNKLVKQVATSAIQLAKGKAVIATSEIRDKIVSELDRLEPTVSAVWRKSEEEKKKSK